jgi:hypothetical protein
VSLSLVGLFVGYFLEFDGFDVCLLLCLVMI